MSDHNVAAPHDNSRFWTGENLTFTEIPGNGTEGRTMNLRCVAFAITIAALSAGRIHAADANRPDPKSVVEAFFAAANVGNVDAALAFFADDGYHMLPGGKKYSGKDELRTLLNLFAREKVHFDLPPDALVKGDVVQFSLEVSTR
jgi:hypothetical protein